eukprot:1111852-Ditylum_brightwellii.AAC.1
MVSIAFNAVVSVCSRVAGSGLVVAAVVMILEADNGINKEASLTPKSGEEEDVSSPPRSNDFRTSVSTFDILVHM